ncbi:MAG: sulfate/molybdate ABC transporter ATP-binding protein [Oscillospiraceae bacterium]|nr:sulfate/molybdate ABC transporter ATP-binding protein [Oscillospiraceae bacterium]
MLSIDIKKKLGAFSLDVSLKAEDGITALLGASGCGKSVTLRCIAGILRPDSGRIELGGRVLFDSARGVNLSPRARRVGYLFQNYSLFPNMTVAQNIAVGANARRGADKRKKADALIESMRLSGLEKHRPHQLSGGQRQRAALARILASEPECLLLDEPFSALDDYLKWQLELELADTLEGFGGTTLYVSHNRAEVYRLCERVCVLTDGKSERTRPVRELFAAPETLSACRISGCKNFSRVRVTPGGEFDALDWGVTLRAAASPPDAAAFIGVRAHYIKPADERGVNTFECAVSRVTDDVFGTVVMLTPPGAIPGARAEFSQIRMEVPKSVWARLREPRSLLVKIEAEDIMPLTE